MNRVAISTGITIEEFERLPDALARNHELVKGELVDVSGNTGYHNSIRDFLVELLRPHVRSRKLGRVIAEQEYNFGGDAHGPDVTFFGSSKVSLYDRRRRVQAFTPDLAIEIVSTNDTFENIMEKASRYRACGTAEVWVLSPSTRQAFVQSSERNAFLAENDTLESPILPGFSISLGQLFDGA